MNLSVEKWLTSITSLPSKRSYMSDMMFRVSLIVRYVVAVSLFVLGLLAAGDLDERERGVFPCVLLVCVLLADVFLFPAVCQIKNIDTRMHKLFNVVIRVLVSKIRVNSLSRDTKTRFWLRALRY